MGLRWDTLTSVFFNFFCVVICESQLLGIVCEVFLNMDIDKQEWFELISAEYIALCYNSFGYSILADLIVG